MTRQEISEREVQSAHKVLMPQVRRGGHVVDSVDDLVPKPVVFREQQEIVVREASVRVSG